MKECPCWKCNKRKIDCHEKCKKYLEWRKGTIYGRKLKKEREEE